MNNKTDLNQQSKNEFGTLTAKQDANNDYTKSNKSSTSQSGGSNKSNKQSSSDQSATSQVLTSQYDINEGSSK